MFMCCTKRSSVINSIYSGQQVFSYISFVIANLSNLIRLFLSKSHYTSKADMPKSFDIHHSLK